MEDRHVALTAQASPLDTDVFVALGVLENINRNYDGAIQALASACRLRPNDHTCWNKLGATLANSGIIHPPRSVKGALRR